MTDHNKSRQPNSPTGENDNKAEPKPFQIPQHLIIDKTSLHEAEEELMHLVKERYTSDITSPINKWNDGYSLVREAELSLIWSCTQAYNITNEHKKRGTDSIVLGESHPMSAHTMVQTLIALSMGQDLGIERSTHAHAHIFKFWAHLKRKKTTPDTHRPLIQEYLKKQVSNNDVILGDDVSHPSSLITKRSQAFLLKHHNLNLAFNDVAYDENFHLDGHDKQTAVATQEYRDFLKRRHTRDNDESTPLVQNNEDIMAQAGLAIRNIHIIQNMGILQQCGQAHSMGDKTKSETPYNESIAALIQKPEFGRRNTLFPVFHSRKTETERLTTAARQHLGYMNCGYLDNRLFHGRHTQGVEQAFIEIQLDMLGDSGLCSAFKKAEKETTEQVQNQVFEETYTLLKQGAFEPQ